MSINTVLQEAMHYIVSITRPEELGRTKLAKALFFADLDTYRRTGNSITGATYIRWPNGPAPRDFYPAVDGLVRGCRIAERKAEHFGYAQHQYWSIEEPALEGLSNRDVATLTAYTRVICENHTASSISDLTHNLAWTVARPDEEIPFAAFLVATRLGKPRASEMAEIEAALGSN